MNKKILLLIPSIFLVAACSSTGGKEEPHTHVDNQPKDHKCDICGIKLTNHIDQTGDDYCDICGEYMGNPDDPEACDKDDDVCRAEKSGSVAENTPKYPFYLKVGEQKKLKTKMKDSSIIEEKYFNWENQDPEHIELKIDEKDGNTAYVTAKVAPAEGFSKIKVINKAAPSVTGEFNAKVIDFDDVNEYLWQCGDTVDRKPFGYVSTKENPAGVQSGVATLGDLDWEFNRSAVRALNSGNGALAFGKGKAPESFTLKTANTRKVKQIIVEHASANSLAKLSVSIGETTFMPVSAPKPNNSKLTYSTIDCSSAKGDIKLSWETPEYDPSREGEADYKAPGATYLKSIRIIYDVEDCLGIKVAEDSLHDIVFSDWDQYTTEGLKVMRITESGEYQIPLSELKIENPDLSGNPSKATVKISFEAHNGTFETSYDIYKGVSLSVKEGTEPDVKDYVEYSEFNPLGLVVNIICEDSSQFDFTEKIKWCDSSKFSETKATATDYELTNGCTKVIGFVEKNPSLGHVEVEINEVNEIVSMKLANEIPTKAQYLESDVFSEKGLVIEGYASDEKIAPSMLVNKLSWYDGSSVENSGGDVSKYSEKLAVGTTKVVGVLKDHEIDNVIVNNIEVVAIDHIAATGALATSDYSAGESFLSAGLSFTLFSQDESLKLTKVKGEEFDWYDGASYDADPQVKTKELVNGSTYVIGEFKFNIKLTVKVDGITVTDNKCSLTLVKSVENIESDARYLVVAKAAEGYVCLDGSLTGSTAMIGTPKVLNDFELNDTAELAASFGKAGFIATVTDGETPMLTLSNDNGNKIGITNSGSISCTTSPAISAGTFTVDDSGKLKLMFSYVKDEVTKTATFGFNTATGKFNCTASGSGEIYLYKFAK